MLCYRQEELRGSQDPYKSISERQHEERKREDRRKLDEDRQRLKEVRCSHPQVFASVLTHCIAACRTLG